MRFSGQTIVVVGGGSGIGKAVALEAVQAGAQVTLSSRDRSKLETAATAIGAHQVVPVDMTDAASVASWVAAMPQIDHLVISASSAVHGRFADLPETDVRRMFDAKFFGPYAITKAALPKMRRGGSITLFSGVLSRRPGMNCSGLGAVNGAIEALTKWLALELGPDLRVDCLSPGMIRSEAYAGMDDDAREAMHDATGASLPVGQADCVEEAAKAVMFLMANTYTTGVVLDVDGGHMRILVLRTILRISLFISILSDLVRPTDDDAMRDFMRVLLQPSTCGFWGFEASLDLSFLLHPPLLAD